MSPQGATPRRSRKRQAVAAAAPAAGRHGSKGAKKVRSPRPAKVPPTAGSVGSTSPRATSPKEARGRTASVTLKAEVAAAAVVATTAPAVAGAMQGKAVVRRKRTKKQGLQPPPPPSPPPQPSPLSLPGRQHAPTGNSDGSFGPSPDATGSPVSMENANDTSLDAPAFASFNPALVTPAELMVLQHQLQQRQRLAQLHQQQQQQQQRPAHLWQPPQMPCTSSSVVPLQSGAAAIARHAISPPSSTMLEFHHSAAYVTADAELVLGMALPAGADTSMSVLPSAAAAPVSFDARLARLQDAIFGSLLASTAPSLSTLAAAVPAQHEPAQHPFADRLATLNVAATSTTNIPSAGVGVAHVPHTPRHAPAAAVHLKDDFGAPFSGKLEDIFDPVNDDLCDSPSHRDDDDRLLAFFA